jgi:serine/threonine protein kinase
LCDFGFSRQLKSNKLVSGSYGTVNYMAPEIARQHEYGVKVDIWSLGVIIYELACGNFPFQAYSKEALLAAVDYGFIMVPKS